MATKIGNGEQQDLKLMKPQNVTGKQLKLLSCQGNVQILERNYPLTILRKNPKMGKFSLQSLRNSRFLARQGLALCGSIEEESNFIQLLKLEGEVDSQMEKWLIKKSGKYTHPEIQIECIQLMPLTILREISKNIQNSVYYTIMADEVTDSSNKEQFVVCSQLC